MRRPGIAWAAHYQITGGGTKMQAIHDRLVHADDDGLGTGTQFLMLAGATSPHVFADPRIDAWENTLGEPAKGMLARRTGTRSNIFTQEEFVTGPEYGVRPAGTTPGPAIQMGSFRTKTVEDEGGREAKVRDSEKIRLASQKIDAIRNGFTDWMRALPMGDKTQIEDTYNRLYNAEAKQKRLR